MNKVSLFLIIAVMIVTSGCGGGRGGNGKKEANGQVAETYTGAAINIDYEKIYQPMIEKLKSEYENTRAYYALFDIDNNGMPELLFKLSFGDGDIISDIYTIKERSPVLLFNPPSDRYGSSKILRNGLITDSLGYSIYKISDDGISVTRIASAEPYDYPNEASRALAEWRYHINDSEVDYDYYVQYLKQQGYIAGGKNIEADIDWKDVVEGFTGGGQYGGVYTFNNPAVEGAEGTVYIYPETDGGLLFYINKTIGAPSYQRAIIDGRIAMTGGKGVFRESHFDKTIPDCVLRFEFSENTLHVIHENGQCGFGDNVFVNTRFERASSEIPQNYTINGSEIYFDQWQKGARIPAEAEKSTFTDARDGRTYKTVTIGAQTWMAENLNYAAGTNYCYDDDNAHCQTYGRLYSWGTALKACPEGWRLPDLDDWKQLIEAVKNQEKHDLAERRTKAAFAFNGLSGITLKSETGWHRSEYKLIRGTDDFGFSALPAGARDRDGNFHGAGNSAFWWVADEDGEWTGKHMGMTFDRQWIWESYANKASGYSVRCVR